MIEYIVAIVIYIINGIIVYGYTVGYFQGEFPRTAIYKIGDDRKFGFMMAIIGPGSIVALFLQGRTKHGMRW